MKKTRPVEGKEDFICPCHGTPVKERVRMVEKEGKRKFAGVYLSCPSYSECGYYVSGDFRVPVL